MACALDTTASSALYPSTHHAPHPVLPRWWRAYFTSGSSALYLFAYSGFYFYSKLDITKTVPMLMYFGYMLIASIGFFCLTGAIGFYACYFFVRTIYAAVKCVRFTWGLAWGQGLADG